MRQFSLLVPSRGRPSHIEALLCSLQKTTIRNERVEIAFCIDTDDRATQTKLDSIKVNSRYPRLDIKVLVRERSSYLNKDYYNYLASRTTGDYIWAIGDDVRFLTPNWDEIVEQGIEEYLKDKPDRVAYIETEDGTDAHHCCFPIITREAFNATGMFFHPEIMTWGADRTLAELYEGVNRICKIEGVALDHISYHDGKSPFDDTASSVRDRFFKDPNCHNKVTSAIIPKQIELLKRQLK